MIRLDERFSRRNLIKKITSKRKEAMKYRRRIGKIKEKTTEGKNSKGVDNKPKKDEQKEKIIRPKKKYD